VNSPGFRQVFTKQTKEEFCALKDSGKTLLPFHTRSSIVKTRVACQNKQISNLTHSMQLAERSSKNIDLHTRQTGQALQTTGYELSAGIYQKVHPCIHPKPKPSVYGSVPVERHNM
jgi:hypothetical protein